MIFSHRVVRSVLYAVMVCGGAALSGAEKKTLLNGDVVKMVQAELPESTILLAIQGTARAFDTSTDALIELKKAGVPAKVIEAMLAPVAASPAAGAGAKETPSAPMREPAAAAVENRLAGLWGSKLTRIDADRIYLIEGETRHDMKYTRPGTRTKTIFPFGGLQQFAVLGGARATLRVKSRTPVFELILPNNVQPSSITALGLLGERGNGSREILIGGGYMSFSAGLPKDRNIAITFEKAADQSAAPEGYDRYEIKPASALKNGEYAFMIAKGSGEAGGVFGAGASASYNFYEFAVD
jgi:hypothetical protein